MNVINYMTDDAGLITLRSREFKLRLLDKAKIRTAGAKLRWQLLNTLVPVLLIILGGLLFNLIRKRRFSNKFKT